MDYKIHFLSGVLLLIAFLTTLLFVKETFVREHQKTLGIKEIWRIIPEKSLTITMFVTFFVLTVALYSVEPIITVYITELSGNTGHIALLAGLAFSASGLANISLPSVNGVHSLVLILTCSCVVVELIPLYFVVFLPLIGVDTTAREATSLDIIRFLWRMP